jgi:hypothetical protein
MAKVCLLTPTGDRPLQLSRSRTYVERSQTEHEVEWVVVDDGIVPFDPGGCRYLRRAPDGAASIGRNILFGIPHCDADYVLVWEDDDWYSPLRVQAQTERLKHVPMHGWGTTMYYHVGASRFLVFDNTQHAAFFETGFQRKRLEALVPFMASSNKQFLDLLLWRMFPGLGSVDRSPRLCVGMKGLPGRPGLAGHILRDEYRSDSGNRVLFRTIGDDAYWYLDLMDRGKPIRSVRRAGRSAKSVPHRTARG